MSAILTLEAAVIRAINMHGNSYDYSKAIYLGKNIPFEIGCNKCGKWFWQIPQNHWAGAGCNQICLTNRKHLACNKGLEQFIIDAIIIYGDLYDYSEFIYIDAHTKGTIICRMHGKFKQDPSHHLRRQGCNKCSKKPKRNLQEFIKAARLIHGDVFDYSLSIFVNMRTKITIICRVCEGQFSQRPDHHLHNTGCPNCKRGNSSKIELEWLDYMQVPNDPKHRQITIRIGIHKYRVDGIIMNTNTIYEFNGDFWHGNPQIYNPNDINKATKTTFGELYNKTIEKKTILENEGYTVISIWENEWNKLVLNKVA